MKTPYTIFHADGREATGEVDWPEEPGYVRIRDMVNPIVEGEPEHVYVLKPGSEAKPERADMFVHEFGDVNGMPVNAAASKLYRAATLLRAPDTDPESLPAIHGTAVLFGRVVWV